VILQMLFKEFDSKVIVGDILCFRFTWIMRTEARQRQQSCHCIKYHVRCRSVSAIFACTLEISQNGGEQVVRIYARNARRCSRYGMRYVYQNRSQMSTSFCYCKL